jgi:hypothetical protein
MVEGRLDRLPRVVQTKIRRLEAELAAEYCEARLPKLIRFSIDGTRYAAYFLSPRGAERRRDPRIRFTVLLSASRSASIGAMGLWIPRTGFFLGEFFIG